MRDTQKYLNWAQLAEKELQVTKDKMEALRETHRVAMRRAIRKHAELERERDELLEALKTLHFASGQRIMAPFSARQEQIVFQNAWTESGKLLSAIASAKKEATPPLIDKMIEEQ